jgi:histidine ammonia-lyase
LTLSKTKFEEGQSIRKLKTHHLVLGKETEVEWMKFREVVPFMDQDRILSIDIQKAYDYIKKKILRETHSNFFPSNKGDK